MRKGMNTLALHVQETLGRNPHAGDLFVFRGARGDKLKMIWHDGLGTSLYVKRLERGTLHLARSGWRGDRDLGGAIELHAVGH
jgi:transposase